MKTTGLDEKKENVPFSRRRLALNLIGLSLLHPLVACAKGGKVMKKGVVIDVVLYSFLDRSIFDIHLNGTDIGVASAYGGTSIVTEVSVPMGEQKLSWRLDGPKGTPRNGETEIIKNHVVVKFSDIPREANYMGVYLYPDFTAEFVFSEFIPENSARGEAILNALKKSGRK